MKKELQTAKKKYKFKKEVVDLHRDDLKKIVDENFVVVLNSEEFKTSVKNIFQHTLARILVSKLEGSIEKCVSTLRSDPTLRAKMILAIEGIIKEVK